MVSGLLGVIRLIPQILCRDAHEGAKREMLQIIKRNVNFTPPAGLKQQQQQRQQLKSRRKLSFLFAFQMSRGQAPAQKSNGFKYAASLSKGLRNLKNL